MFQVIAEIAETVAEAAEEINLTEAVVQDIENLLSQISEMETSAEEVSSAEGIEQLEANTAYFKDGQLYVTDEHGVIETLDGKAETEATKDVVSDVELYNSPEKRLEKALQGDGKWLGEPGKSGFIPNNQEARQILKDRGLESIRYDANCEPDFSPVSEGTVEIDNMTEWRLGEGRNYDQAFKKLADQWNSMMKDGKSDWNSRDVVRWASDNKLSPHERMDRKTVDFVPRIINLECKHIGGCSECKLRDAVGGVFDV